MVNLLRRVSWLLLTISACRSSPVPAPPIATTNVPRSEVIRTYEDVETYAGKTITLQGTFDHIRGEHGVITLDSDLRIYIPHFDLFRRNDDWFKYVGRRVTATGTLHTYTKEIPGYHGPSLEITGFSGSP